ncbi:MAG: DUF2177 family protein [Planctomycetes bacterium]|nr:DUF2177 family protein [Planctomycetota bacterium]
MNYFNLPPRKSEQKSEQEYELHKILDILSKCGVVFLGICYVLGFIIVNIYLSHFGITDLGLVKSKYIAAGVLYLFFIAATAGFPLFFLSNWEKTRKIPKTMEGVVVLFAVVLLSVFWLPIEMFGIELLNRSTLISYFSYTIGNTFIFIYAFSKNLPFTLDKFRPFFPQILGTVLILLGSTGAFADFIYPRIHTHYGGGRLVQVQLTYDEEKLPLPLFYVLNVLQCETDFVYQDAEAITLYLVLDRDKQIYDATISLPHTAVKSIVFLGESPRTSFTFNHGNNRNIYKIAQIFTDVCDNTEKCKQEEVLKGKLKNIELNNEEIDYFVDLFREVTTKVGAIHELPLQPHLTSPQKDSSHPAPQNLSLPKAESLIE